MPEPTHRLVPGTKVDDYEIISLIGRGQRTEVFSVYDPRAKTERALKIYHAFASPTAEQVAQFRKTASVVSRLNHPNIIRVYASGVYRQQCYTIIDLIERRSLRDLIATHPTGLDHPTTVRIFSQVVSALAHAHDKGVVHGNLKPDNILLDDSERPILSDFTLFIAPGTGNRTHSAAYLSPQQVTGLVPTQACDIYSLGVVMYEMVTGDVPFKGPNFAAVAAQHREAAPRPPRHSNPDLDPRIEQVILTSLNKEPEQRYLSARAMLVDLETSESGSQYETLALDRSMAREVRRRSEIKRFEASRTDAPGKSATTAQPDGDDRIRQISPFAIAVIALIVVGIAVMLLLMTG